MRPLPHMCAAICASVFLLLIAESGRAEIGRMNVHLELGPGFAVAGWQRTELGPGLFGNLAFELSLKPWFGAQVHAGYHQFFGVSTPDEAYTAVESPYLFLAGLGVRFRPLNDEKGYLRPWKSRPDHTGNLWGNLFVDLSVDYALTGGLSRLGANAGLGYEFSLFDGLQIGPFVRGTYVYQPEAATERASSDAWIVSAGLSFSLAVPPKGMRMSDSDGDGLYDPLEKCPDAPEDMDNFQDDDGCPDPDNDGDGLRDESDACPLEPEDFDGFEDDDGCPESDNDLDGLPDDRDRCPNEREDFDTFEDQDGCPDPDNDGDGVPDESDRCPEASEVMNGVEDEDGCPESDEDKDGVFDSMDMCPEAAETLNGIEDEDGCPDEGLVEVKDDRILLGKRIFFDFNMARIKTQGKAVIRQLADLLRVHPEYEVVTIEGHADRSGNRKANERISRKRAERVRDMLIRSGIEPSRLTVEGLGESRPWVPYGDAQDPGKNRRVEVVIRTLAEDAHVAESLKQAVEARKTSTPEPPEATDE